MAQTLKLHHHSDEAAREYEIVLQQDPTSFAGRVGLASCYVDGRQWDEAQSCVEQIPRDKWDDADVLYVRGRIAEGAGRYDEAIELLQTALEANPSDSVACYHLVQCYQRKGDDASASKYQDRLDRIEKDQKRLVSKDIKDIKDAKVSFPWRP